MKNWITISTYEYSQDAHMVKNYLESEGITVFLKDEVTSRVASYYTHAIGGVKLQVNEKEYDKALDILEKGGYIADKSAVKPMEVEVVEFNPANAKNTCPFCKSTDIEKIKLSDPIQTMFYTIFGALIPVLRLPSKCNRCKKVWKYKK